jgi:hypothetical protein
MEGYIFRGLFVLYQITHASSNLQHPNPTRLSIQLMEYGHEKPEATAVSIDPKFSSYLYDDYLSSISHTKLSDDVFLERYVQHCTVALDSFSVFSWANLFFTGISGSTGAVMTLKLPWRSWMISVSLMASKTRFPANPQRYVHFSGSILPMAAR